MSKPSMLPYEVVEALREQTAFDSIEDLLLHVQAGGKPPSFRSDNAAGVRLSNALFGSKPASRHAASNVRRITYSVPVWSSG